MLIMGNNLFLVGITYRWEQINIKVKPVPLVLRNVQVKIEKKKKLSRDVSHPIKCLLNVLLYWFYTTHQTWQRMKSLVHVHCAPSFASMCGILFYFFLDLKRLISSLLYTLFLVVCFSQYYLTTFSFTVLFYYQFFIKDSFIKIIFS